MSIFRSIAIGGVAALAAVSIAAVPLEAANAAAPAAAPAAEPAASQTPTARADTPSDVVFIGDSVTAGFGYFGSQENAYEISGTVVNQAFPNAWNAGDNALSACSPATYPEPKLNQCSNNNLNGAPWDAEPWQNRPMSPYVAYSYKIAGAQNPATAASIVNWAVTGSTPADWDPNGGAFVTQLNSIKNQTVVMTLGANPILADFLKIRVVGFNKVHGVCADLATYTNFIGWLSGWWANPTSTLVDCARTQWEANNQSEHLSNVYRTLLANNNKIMVLGYYASCPWSFGNWQPNANISEGPAEGNSCASQTEEIDAPGKPVISQLDHAVGVGAAMNEMIAAAVAGVQNTAAGGHNLQFVLPDQDKWLNHKASDPVSWIFKNDTWIHPSEAGHEQLAKTVIAGMCQDMGRWCGSPPSWNKQSVRATFPKKNVRQRIKGKAPLTIRVRSARDLPSYTKQGQTIHWKAAKSSKCTVDRGWVVAKKRAGVCKLTGTAIKSASLKTLTVKVRIRVRLPRAK